MNLIQKISTLFRKRGRTTQSTTHFAHGTDFAINPKDISYNVRKVTQRLRQERYEAYLVGGGVRDLLLNLSPKDFDVATDATPEQVRRLFRNCRIIGRRFRLAHVYFKDEIIEVATFRAQHEPTKTTDHVSDHGMILRDNTYGDLEEDSWRRDFTINALYYDVQKDLIIDHTGGLADIKQKQIQIIGDAEQRYREDPVRMLRALRFAAKLHFNIADNTAEPLARLKNLIWNVSPSRIFEEILKLFFTGHATETYQTLHQFDFFAPLFPQVAATFIEHPSYAELIHTALANTDARIAADKSINPAFLLAVLLWGPFQQQVKELQKHQKPLFAQQQAFDVVIRDQLQTIAIPKRLTQMIKEIWELQYRLSKRHGKRAWQSLEMPRFRAAYDFLLLRASNDSSLKELVDWWTEFQIADYNKQQEMVNILPVRAPRGHAK